MPQAAAAGEDAEDSHGLWFALGPGVFSRNVARSAGCWRRGRGRALV